MGQIQVKHIKAPLCNVCLALSDFSLYDTLQAHPHLQSSMLKVSLLAPPAQWWQLSDALVTSLHIFASLYMTVRGYASSQSPCSSSSAFKGPMCTHAKSLQSCPTLCDPMGCGPPGSSVRGILWAGILEWVAMPSSRESA